MDSKCELEKFRLNIGKSIFPLRQESFDTLKFFLAFLVVVIHTGFTGHVGLGINAFARIAVPLFFMITGYYLPTMTDEKFRKHLIKIIYLTVFSTLFYILISYIQSHVGSEVSSDWFAQTFSIKGMLKWMLLNGINVGGHLWYFYALLYVFAIIYITRKFGKMNILYVAIPFLFLGNYLLSFFGHIVCYRNFLFTGLLYVLLGYLFRIHEKRLLDVFNKSHTLIIGLVIICICLGIEMPVYKMAGFIVRRDHYFFTLPMVVCVFILALRNPHWGSGSSLTLVGKRYSAYIYILHIFFMTFINYGLKILLGKETYQDVIQNNLFKNGYPFLVFGITLLSVMIGYKIWSLFLRSSSVTDTKN